MFLINILRRPLDWIRTLLAAVLTGRVLSYKKQKAVVGYFMKTQDKIQASLCKDGTGEFMIVQW